MKKCINRGILIFSSTSFLVAFTLLLIIHISDGGNMEIFKKRTKEQKKEAISKMESSIDWEKLQKINPDVYAWLSVPGTNIDYPVLGSKTESEDYYLHHDLYKKFSFAGSIYSRKENNKNFTDDVSVLYGHNMRNGSMFADIKKFESKDFFEDHSKIMIYLPDRTLIYHIVSIYHTDDKNILSRSKDIDKYKKEILSPRNGQVRKEISKADGKILTLSTCASNEKERRVLQSVLEKDIKLKK